MLELDGEAEWSQEGPTLSNDIWKKFQLIPTPPRSPSHDTDLPLSPSDLITFSDLDLPPFEWEGLESNDFGLDLENILLPDHLPNCGGPGGLPCAHGTCNSCTQLALAGSELRHDCMWRGTCTAEAHTHQMKDMHRSHKESTSNYPELLLDPSVFESAAGFTHLDDLQEDDDEDMEDLEAEDDLAGRPDTPSESSETDTDEDQEDEDDEEDEDEDGEDAPAIHVDHSYYCPRAPSPRHAHAPALPHTPSESEDEIDVVSVGSNDSAYSSSSSRYGGKNITTISSRSSSEKRKMTATASVASRTSGGDPTSMTHNTPTPAIPSTTTPALPTAAATTTTFVTASSPRKILKARPSTQTTSSSSSSKSRHNRDKRKPTSNSHTSSNSITSNTNTTDSMPNPAATTTTTPTPSPTNANAPYTTRPLKRIHRATTSSHHHSHHSRKRKSHRGYDDDPERRHLHNSLERMRRVDLRNAFEDLRNLVPDLCDREKAPKVEILRRASEHCYSLTQRGRLLEQEKEKQKRLQGELRRRLAALHKQHGRL